MDLIAATDETKLKVKPVKLEEATGLCTLAFVHHSCFMALGYVPSSLLFLQFFLDVFGTGGEAKDETNQSIKAAQEVLKDARAFFSDLAKMKREAREAAEGGKHEPAAKAAAKTAAKAHTRRPKVTS